MAKMIISKIIKGRMSPEYHQCYMPAQQQAHMDQGPQGPWDQVQRHVRRKALIIDFLLQLTILNQHYAEQNSNFLILDCLVSKEYDKDFLY